MVDICILSTSHRASGKHAARDLPVEFPDGATPRNDGKLFLGCLLDTSPHPEL